MMFAMHRLQQVLGAATAPFHDLGGVSKPLSFAVLTSLPTPLELIKRDVFNLEMGGS